MPTRRVLPRVLRAIVGLVPEAAGTFLLSIVGLVPAEAVEPADRALDAPVKATWVAVPLGEWTDGVTAIAGRPVLRHRRLDPERPVTIEADSSPLGGVLEAAARSVDAAVDVLASSIWLVPPDRRGWLEAAEKRRIREIAALSPDVRRRALARSPWAWPAGSRPRDLVAAAARGGGIPLAGLDRVPHDHLPAATLPELTLAERLDLVLAHYDLRVAWDGSPRIVPTGGGAPEEVPARAGGTGGRRQGRPGRATEVYSLRLDAPLERALGSISARLGLTLELDRESLASRGVLPGEIVRTEIRDASRDEVLDAIVKPLGLRWTIEGSRLRVFAP